MSALNLIRPEIRALSAYHVQPAEGFIKLDAMENPWPLTPALQQRLGERLARAAYNRYPDANPQALKTLISKVFAVPEGAELLLGNGSDELIQILAQALARPGAALLSVEPAFVMFRVLANACGLEYIGVPLQEDFSVDLLAMLAVIRARQPALIFLAIPNNPTGNAFAPEAIQAILKEATGIVVIDEAYFPFRDGSYLSFLPNFPNMLVMRTVSKLGLAGIRLGFLAGAPELLGELEKLRLPYNISVATQVIAQTVLEEGHALNDQTQQLRQERVRVFTALRDIQGVHPFESEANFILLRVLDAQGVFDALKRHGILIKNLSNAHALLRGCLRVTVGTPEQNDRFLDALKASVLAVA
jgi:histidinol-phosphate aminotransferase